MKMTMSSLVTAATISAAALATPTIAQEANVVNVAVTQDDGAQQHIDLAGRLRMLSQLIPAAACHHTAGMDIEGSREILEMQAAAFEEILTGLEFGSAELGMPYPEERRKTLVEIHAVRDLWAPMRAAAAAVANDQNTAENLQMILDHNLEVLAAAQTLVTEITVEYTNPADMVQADAFLIDIAGRQRMLIQMMSKDSCVLSQNPTDEDAKTALESSMQVFSSSLIALRDGMPSAGIRKAPTAEIAASLGAVYDQWTALQPVMASIIEGNGLDAEAGTRKFQDMNTLMKDMNQIVGMYVAEIGS